METQVVTAIAWRRSIYDFPGLGSKVAVRATKNLSPPRVAGLVDALQPTSAVLRPNEFGELVNWCAGFHRQRQGMR
jgi:hypothetical protein